MKFSLLIMSIFSITEAFHSNGTPFALMQRSLYGRRRSNILAHRQQLQHKMKNNSMNEFSSKYNKVMKRRKQVNAQFQKLQAIVSKY
jgi:hypothetical protein